MDDNLCRHLHKRGLLLRTGQVAARLKVSTQIIGRWQHRGLFSTVFELNGLRYFDAKEVFEFQIMNEAWQIATNLRPGVLDADQTMRIKELTLQLVDTYQECELIVKYELANFLKVTPYTIDLWERYGLLTADEKVIFPSLCDFLCIRVPSWLAH